MLLRQAFSALRLNVRARTSSRTRWELDAFRGVAIVMMIAYHFMYDLYFFLGRRDVFSPFWSGFQHATATLFILVAGVSTCLAASSTRLADLSWMRQWREFLIRGGTIFAWGMALTAITAAALGQAAAIRFGILHLIGASVFLSFPFLRLPWLALALGVALHLTGSWLDTRIFEGIWTRFFWLGFAPEDMQSVDYFPLIRWFGLFLIGSFIGRKAYAPQGPDSLSLPGRDFLPFRVLRAMGVRSLPIYLLHQPLLFLGFILFGLWTALA